MFFAAILAVRPRPTIRKRFECMRLATAAILLANQFAPVTVARAQAPATPIQLAVGIRVDTTGYPRQEIFTLWRT